MRLCRHRYQAVIRHARHRVYLDQPGLLCDVKKEIHAPPARCAQRVERLSRQRLQLRFLLLRQTAGTVIARRVGLVFGLVVIKIPRRLQPDQRQRGVADYRGGIFGAIHPALRQYLVVIAIRVLPCGLQIGFAIHPGHAKTRTFM